jgi:quinol monooxygenase YgiN
MIIRVLHAKVFPGRQAEFRQIIELLSVPQVLQKTGMIGLYPGETNGESSNEFVLVSLWKNLAKYKNYSLDDWIKLILPEEALPLLAEWRLQHYQTFGITEESSKPLFNYMSYQPEA